VVLQQSRSSSAVEGHLRQVTPGDTMVLLWSISQQQRFATTNLEAVFFLVLGSFPFCYCFVPCSFSRKQSSLSWLLTFNSWPEGMGSGSQLLGWTVVYWKELHRAEL